MEEVPYTGLYRCGVCQDAYEHLRKGDPAPPCPNCYEEVRWEYRVPGSDDRPAAPERKQE